jgi:TPR repeat protein
MRESIKVGLVALALSLSLTAQAVSGPFEDGMSAFSHGDGATALRLWQPLAEQGDANAQFELGVMYESGRGVPPDYPAAMKWYLRAADRGHAFAKLSLGAMYENGEGVPQDFVQAHKWYNLAVAGLPASETEIRAVAEKLLNGVAAKMTAAQIAEAQQFASEWRPE